MEDNAIRFAITNPFCMMFFVFKSEQPIEGQESKRGCTNQADQVGRSQERGGVICGDHGNVVVQKA